jgi:Lrp/AsnC family transcriptional regulator for asnA, asnC and gidA
MIASFGNIYYTTNGMNKIDNIDKQIVRLLAQNARQSSETLAKQLSISSATIRRRVNKLVSSGAIHMVAAIDPAKFGLSFVTIIALDVAHDKLDSIARLLAAKEQIMWISTTTGRFDIIALASFSSAEDFYEFMQGELTNVEGLNNSETFVCLHIQKGQYPLV